MMMQQLTFQYLLKYLAVGTIVLSSIGWCHSASAAEIQRDRVILVEVPGKDRELIEASTVENSEIAVIVTDLAGNRRALQLDYVIASLPILPEDRSGLSMDAIRSTIERYQQVIQSSPQFKLDLESHRAGWQQLLVDLESEQAERAAERAAQLQAWNVKADAFLARPYAIDQPYSKEQLAAVIEQGSALVQNLPDRSEALTQALKLWESHLGHLEAGDIIFEGKWVSAAEVQRLRQEKEQAAQVRYLDQLELKMDAVIFSQNTVWIMIGIVASGLLIPLYLLVQIGISQLKGEGFSVMQFCVCLLSAGLLAFYGYLGYRCTSDPATITQYLDKTRDELGVEDQPHLRRTLFVSSEPETLIFTASDSEVKLGAQEINGLLQQKVEFVMSDPSGIFVAEREDFALEFNSQYVNFYEQVRLFGRSHLIRYQLSHEIQDGVLMFEGLNVYLGNLQLPAKLKSMLWMNLRSDLVQLFETTGIPQFYQLAGLESNQLKLIMVERPRASHEYLTGGSSIYESQNSGMIDKTALLQH